MNLQGFRNYCLQKPGVKEDYPFDTTILTMKVGSKMFALTNTAESKVFGELVSTFAFINLKCEPEKGDDLRKNFPAIVPAWHMNKRHWNSIKMDGSIEESLIKHLIDHSYELVVKKVI